VAIIELQVRTQAFLEYFKAELNRRTLPFATWPPPYALDLQALQGRPLERIVCVGCSAEPTAGADHLTLTAQLVVHYHEDLASVRAAGSLQPAVTKQLATTLRFHVSVLIVTDPTDRDGCDRSLPADQQPPKRAKLRASVPLMTRFPAKDVSLCLPPQINVESAAVVASEEVVAIRIGTRPDDPVSAPIVDRVGNSDWSQLIAGQLFADTLVAALQKTVDSVVKKVAEIKPDKDASGAWLPATPWGSPPRAIAGAEVTAVNQTVLNIDVSIAVSLIGELQASGHSLVATVKLTWDPDTTVLEVVGGLFVGLFGSIAVHEIAEDMASEAILGRLPASLGGPGGEAFKKIGETEDSVTYQLTGSIPTPGSRFVLNHSEVTNEGVVASGTLDIGGGWATLEGEVIPPSSGLETNCSARTVAVKFYPAEVYLRALGTGAPKILKGEAPLYEPKAIFEPPNAWVATTGAGNSWLDLVVKFADPPTGRLPPGTATSVFLHTDCGLRWADLGVIPADHPPPSVADVAEMINNCMVRTDPWGRGVLNLEWLVDPPHQPRDIDPVRQWTVALRNLAEATRVEFVARGPRRRERVLGVIEGRQNVAAQVTTDADETLQIRTNRPTATPPPVVSQRWVIPFASVPLKDPQRSIASVGGAIAVRGQDGETLLVELGSEGHVMTSRVDGRRQSEPGIRGVLDALTREEQRSREAWAAGARVDKQTVAVIHRGALLIGTVAPATRL
jgi:hypothetical protein